MRHVLVLGWLFIGSVFTYLSFVLMSGPAPSPDLTQYPTPFVGELGSVCYDWLYERRFLIIFLGFLLVFLTTAFQYVWEVFSKRRAVRRSTRDLIEATMKIEILHCFKDNGSRVRGTLFEVRGWFYTATRYHYRCFIRDFRLHRAKKLLLYHFSHRPKIGRKYLNIVARWGEPHSDGSSTIFLVPTMRDEIDGFVPYTFYEKKPRMAELPDLGAINLDGIRVKEELTSSEKDLVDEYMKKGKIKYFDKLRAIHRRSVRLWGTVLYGGSAQAIPRAVLMLDFEDKEVFLRENWETDLVKFCNQVDVMLASGR